MASNIIERLKVSA